MALIIFGINSKPQSEKKGRQINMNQPNEPKNDNDEQKIIDLESHETKYIVTVNDLTGETISYVPMRKKKKKLGVGWLAAYQHGLDYISTLPLTGEQLRVFLQMLSKLDFDNYIRVSQAELENTLGIKQQNIARAIRALLKYDVIVEGPRAGLHKTYRLNPNIGHKGSNIEQTVVEYEQLKQAQEKKQQAKQQAKLEKLQATSSSDTVSSDV